MSRVRELDALRGLASLGVVLHHGLIYSGAVSDALAGHLRSTPLLVLANGRPLVLLFFVLSGFVLARSLARHGPGLRAYLMWSLQRVIRLVLPALAAVLLSAALYELTFDGAWPGETLWMQAQNWAAPPDAWQIVIEGLLLKPGTMDNVLWSLIIELRLCLLIPLMVWFAGTGDRLLALALAALGISALAGGSWPTALTVTPDELHNAQALAYFVLPFTLGVCLSRSGLCDVRPGPIVLWTAAFAIVGLARPPLDITAVVGATLLVWLVQQPGPIAAAMRLPVLAWLGKVSFSLYLVHVPLLNAAFHLLHATLPVPAIAASAIAASLPAAWLFYRVVEAPAHRMARTFRWSDSAPFIGQKVLAARQIT